MKEQDDRRLTDDVTHGMGHGDPFAAAIRGTKMAMVIMDQRQPDGTIVFANEAFQALTGYDGDEIPGRNCRFLQGPGTAADAVKAIGDAVRAGKDGQVDILNYRRDGSTFWNALYLSPARNEAGEVQFFFASQLDVSDRIKRPRRDRRAKGFGRSAAAGTLPGRPSASRDARRHPGTRQCSGHCPPAALPIR